jgi:predicted aldo/keto reductase-like oxidoreductase
MRFPAAENEAIQMVRHAIDNGVNYLDTAYVYQNSEVITGKALKDGYRGKVFLATKSPIWNITKHEDFEKYLDESLTRLGTDYFDVYLLHNMNPVNWETVKKYDGFTFLDNMIKKGKIRHKAFSIHNSLKAFKEVADSFDWEMAQIQLNLLGQKQQAGVEGLKYAADKGMAVVIMEPLMGGYLLNNVPSEVKDLLREYPEKRPLVEWCFRWLYDKPEATVILSGTSSLDQLKENLKIFEHSKPGVMTDGDRNFIDKLRDAFEAKKSVGCTGCYYCLPCPKNIFIPEIFTCYNKYQLMKPDDSDKKAYKNFFIARGGGADNCVSCGECEKKCPQGLAIPELLKTAHQELTA